MNHAHRPMALLRHLLITVSVLMFAAHAMAEEEQKSLTLLGAGATFPAPLYLRWFRDYHGAHPQVRIDYQGTSSSGGVTDLTAGRTDFAGSDLPLTDAQVPDVPGGILQVPMAASGIVAVYNLAGVSQLRLSRDALVGIFSGTVTRWNDAAIAATNPTATLPDMPITVVARADSSGTSYKFTRYLSALSEGFAEAVGTTMTPSWPEALKDRAGLVRGRGNGGVAASVRAIPGSIGYVQYPFGFLPGISMAALENRSGAIVAPGDAGFEAALQSVQENHSVENGTDPLGDACYPIVGFSWLVLRKAYDEPGKLTALKDIIAYAMGPGQDVTEQLGYVRFPQSVIDYVHEELK
jgi:phosphate transport system substrate-binding protein